jgi:hypothetical protein
MQILIGDKRWKWEDEDEDDYELELSGIYTRNEFKRLLNDFRSDTPDGFIGLFKNCVQFSRIERRDFRYVSFNLKVLHLSRI